MLTLVRFGDSHSKGQTYAKLGVTKKRRANYKKIKSKMRIVRRTENDIINKRGLYSVLGDSELCLRS